VRSYSEFRFASEETPEVLNVNAGFSLIAC
jgi:hypothetical protein